MRRYEVKQGTIYLNLSHKKSIDAIEQRKPIDIEFDNVNSARIFIRHLKSPELVQEIIICCADHHLCCVDSFVLQEVELILHRGILVRLHLFF